LKAHKHIDACAGDIDACAGHCKCCACVVVCAFLRATLRWHVVFIAEGTLGGSTRPATPPPHRRLARPRPRTDRPRNAPPPPDASQLLAELMALSSGGAQDGAMFTCHVAFPAEGATGGCQLIVRSGRQGAQYRSGRQGAQYGRRPQLQNIERRAAWMLPESGDRVCPKS
jgi:hypothetical protein